MKTFPNLPRSVNGAPNTPLVGLVPMLLEVLALCGYGLWMLLGLALALGIYGTGCGEAWVPLALGCVFVSAGLLAACLQWVPEWHGWRVGLSEWPTREALLALGTYLPVLGLAGLVRGHENFWVARLFSLFLMLCSLFCLITSAYGYRARRLASQAGMAAQLPVSRVLAAWYGGGLWLWVCLVFQARTVGNNPATWPWAWAIGLLLMAMLLGLVDGVGWQSLRGSALGKRARGLQRRRFLAALLICAVPCLSLPLVPFLPGGRWLALCAATACVIGKSLELWLYDSALGRVTDAACVL